MVSDLQQVWSGWFVGCGENWVDVTLKSGSQYVLAQLQVQVS